MSSSIPFFLNLLAAIISLAFLVYTFFARDHLTEHARNFVTEKTLAYSQPLVDVAKAGLASPLSSSLLTAEKREEFKNEISRYDSDPVQYVASLTSADQPGFGRGKLAVFKEKIHAYYQSTLAALIRDLRIFSGSNLVASLFALGFLLKKGDRKSHAVRNFSLVIFTAVVLSTVGYWQGMSFFQILFKTHLGWWYPVVIALTALRLVRDSRWSPKPDSTPGGPPR